MGIVGRPSKFTVRRRAWVLQMLGAGASRRHACAVAGIDPATLRSWLARGRRAIECGIEESGYAEFLRAVEDAEAKPSLGRVVDPSSLPDVDEVRWAIGYLERSGEWSDPDPAPDEPTIIQLSLGTAPAPRDDE